MIATILPGSADFHAVGYNEHKVSKGLARLIEMRNFGTVGLAGRPTTEELTGYLTVGRVSATCNFDIPVHIQRNGSVGKKHRFIV